MHSRQFANFGGEDRLWLSPEGGPFGLWFKPGREQSFDNWQTASGAERESLSPALALETGQTLTHHHRTVHLKADAETLVSLAEQVLGVKLEAVREAMLGE